MTDKAPEFIINPEFGWREKLNEFDQAELAYARERRKAEDEHQSYMAGEMRSQIKGEMQSDLEQWQLAAERAHSFVQAKLDDNGTNYDTAMKLLIEHGDLSAAALKHSVVLADAMRKLERVPEGDLADLAACCTNVANREKWQLALASFTNPHGELFGQNLTGLIRAFIHECALIPMEEIDQQQEHGRKLDRLEAHTQALTAALDAQQRPPKVRPCGFIGGLSFAGNRIEDLKVPD